MKGKINTGHTGNLGLCQWDIFGAKTGVTSRHNDSRTSTTLLIVSSIPAVIVVGRPNGTKKMLKRSFIYDDDEWAPTSKFKKPRPISTPMIVDLTITDDDDLNFLPPLAISSSTLGSQNPKPKAKPTPKLPISYTRILSSLSIFHRLYIL